jgi:hypothetical protein
MGGYVCTWGIRREYMHKQLVPSGAVRTITTLVRGRSARPRPLRGSASLGVGTPPQRRVGHGRASCTRQPR